ncbi:MAG TPA: trypsin-like peptidase domain-containing protein [Solirubrobacterales bacterium]
MTVLDWGIVAFVLALVLWGFREGVLAGGLIALVAVGFVWAFGVAALHAPVATELRHDVRRSLILRSLDQVLPPSETVIRALRRIDPAPEVSGAPPPMIPPDPSISSDPDVQQAGDSVVRVYGTACGLGLEGSGWAARPDLVVTNAHVIAGEDDTTVTTRDGASLEATAVHYDPINDLALLHVGTELPALPLAPDPRYGAVAAVLGYPGNGPYSVVPARFGETRDAVSDDSYGRGPLHRSVSSLRGNVRSGNSGGPLVDGRGRVMGTVFAATTTGVPGGFAVPNEIVRAALDGARRLAVDTGPCVG